jgi:prevent-host-death family protein
MSEMSISEASYHLVEVAHQAVSTGEVVYLTERGRPVVALVPAVDASAERAAAADTDASEKLVDTEQRQRRRAFLATLDEVPLDIDDSEVMRGAWR